MRIYDIMFCLSTRSAAVLRLAFQPHDISTLDDLHVTLKSDWFQNWPAHDPLLVWPFCTLQPGLVGRHLIYDCYTSNLFYVTTGFSTLPLFYALSFGCAVLSISFFVSCLRMICFMCNFEDK